MKSISPGRGQQGGALQVVLAIIGGLVVLCLLAVLVGLWWVKQYVQVEVERKGDVKRVEIRTPIGDLEVRKAEDVASQLKLPVYSGATPEEEGASVRLRGRLGDEEGGLDIAVAKFRTGDPFERVDAWYGEQLGPDFKREQGRIVGTNRRGDIHAPGEWEIRVEPGGDDVLYTQERQRGARCVVLKHEWDKVKITLFEIWEARPQ